MKKIFSIISASVLLGSVWGQKLTPGADDFGIFINPILEMSEINGDVGFSSGYGGAVLVGDYIFGVYEINTFNFSQKVLGEYVGSGHLEYTGLWLGRRIPAIDRLSVVAGVKAAWGHARIPVYETKAKDSGYEGKLFVFTPEVGMDWAISPNITVALTAGYRWVDGLDEMNKVNADDFKSLTTGLGLKFGWFGPAKKKPVAAW